SQPITFDFYPQGISNLGSIRNSETVERLIKISDGWFIITRREGKLIFNDLRFGTLNEDSKDPEFVFSYELIVDGETVTAQEIDNKGQREAGKIMKRLFTRIAGN